MPIVKKLSKKPTLAVIAAPPVTGPPADKSTTDKMTEDGSVSQLRTHLKAEKESRQQNLASANSSQMLSTSRNESASQRLL